MEEDSQGYKYKGRVLNGRHIDGALGVNILGRSMARRGKLRSGFVELSSSEEG